MLFSKALFKTQLKRQQRTSTENSEFEKQTCRWTGLFFYCAASDFMRMNYFAKFVNNIHQTTLIIERAELNAKKCRAASRHHLRWSADNGVVRNSKERNQIKPVLQSIRRTPSKNNGEKFRRFCKTGINYKLNKRYP